jgi:hypothetical protein
MQKASERDDGYFFFVLLSDMSSSSSISSDVTDYKEEILARSRKQSQAPNVRTPRYGKPNQPQKSTSLVSSPRVLLFFFRDLASISPPPPPVYSAITFSFLKP